MPADAAATAVQDGYRYQPGFGNEFVSEAVAGALPAGRNSPQRAPLGLYAEQLSGTAFTQPRAANRRTWVYRMMPSAAHPRFSRIGNGALRAGPFGEIEPDPNRLRWDPLPLPAGPADFIDGLYTMAGNGDPRTRSGMADPPVRGHRVDDRPLLRGRRRGTAVRAAAGRAGAAHRARPAAAGAGGDRGHPARHPVPGGAARTARPAATCARTTARRSPCRSAARSAPTGWPASGTSWPRPRPSRTGGRAQLVQVVQKFGGNLWAADYDHSPLDVVAWHGNYAPVKYDTANFMVIGTVSFDHPDPSIYTVLTSPSELPGLANVDFVIFPPRWLVGEDTFRPPWFHRNIMSEFMGLVHGAYDAKAEGFLPGGASLHNTFTSHGPDAETFARASRGGAGPAEDHRHPGVHVREPLDDHPDPAGHGGRAPAARLRRGVGRPDPGLRWAGPLGRSTRHATSACPARPPAGRRRRPCWRCRRRGSPACCRCGTSWPRACAPPSWASAGTARLRLPTEVQFARHYGVSLTTVRQALSSLAADGPDHQAPAARHVRQPDGAALPGAARAGLGGRGHGPAVQRRGAGARPDPGPGRRAAGARLGSAGRGGADPPAAARRRCAGQLRGELPASRARGADQRRGPGRGAGHQDPPRRAVAAADQDRQRGLRPHRAGRAWPRCCRSMR